ncbi:hypothetical protein [Micromonospora sp. NPDC051296]|uniref:hypothetical protein n=1 Tax=Micromonospora sp. NPDC051296 TaxID=3155046 RepID=UPI00342D0EF5
MEALSRLKEVMPRPRLASVLVWASLTALTPACGASTEPSTAEAGGISETGPTTSAEPSGHGDAAVWFLGPGQSLQESSTTFTALVSRLACNSGVTGQVLAPEIRMSDSEVVVTFLVAPKQPGPATCPTNDQVSYEVDLGEPLRGRTLVDGQCLSGREAATTSFCTPASARFRP